MAANYVLLQRTQLTSSVGSLTFSNIPQTGYTDLKIVVSTRTDQSSVNRSFKVQPNGVDITARRLGAEGTTFAAYADTGVGIYATGTGATSNTFDNVEIYIPNYFSTSTYKAILVDGVNENNGTDSGLILTAGMYSSNTAISSITLLATLGSFITNSTFSIYGLAAVGTTPVVGPKASGGDIVVNDGTYWYHTFLSSGVFTPAQSITCNYLVVAGGGGGGSGVGTGAGGSGGGAGGLRSSVTATGGGGSLEAALSLAAQSYPVTVGAGGVGASGSTGTSGTNSVLSTITSIGGGGGGRGSSTDGLNGGSGGGSYAINTPGTGTANQGYAGGKSAGGSSGSGGGGAGSVGVASVDSSSTKGNGGSGVTISALATPTSTGVSGAYAGGGGGGRYNIENGGPGTATAGGGAGGNSTAGGAGSVGAVGTVNTGGGGGGGGAGTAGGASGGNGGAGIVIIRYVMA